MADVEDVIFTRLSTFAGLSALIGTRIFPDVLPQEETLPAVVYQRVSTGRIHVHEKRAENAQPRFQIAVWGSTAKSARAAARQVVLALEGWKDASAAVRIDAGLVENEMTDRDPETEEFRRIVDVMIWHGD